MHSVGAPKTKRTRVPERKPAREPVPKPLSIKSLKILLNNNVKRLFLLCKDVYVRKLKQEKQHTRKLDSMLSFSVSHRKNCLYTY